MARSRTGREPYNTTIDKDLIKSLKFLSAELGRHQNDMVEEAIQDLIIKYSKPSVLTGHHENISDAPQPGKRPRLNVSQRRLLERLKKVAEELERLKAKLPECYRPNLKLVKKPPEAKPTGS